MRRAMWLVAVAVLSTAAACGGGGEAATGGGEGEASLTIEEPADGSEVETPFTVRFSTEVELGPTETGAFHVHLWFDGNQDDYQVVESDSFEVTDLSSGEHTISASLHHADHSAAGAEDEVGVTVAGGGGGTGGDEGGGDTGYDY